MEIHLVYRGRNLGFFKAILFFWIWGSYGNKRTFTLFLFSLQRYHFILRSLIYLPNVTSLLSSLSPQQTRGVTKVTHGSIEYVNINSENTLLLILSSCKKSSIKQQKGKI
jgi:hypothetical protein